MRTIRTRSEGPVIFRHYTLIMQSFIHIESCAVNGTTEQKLDRLAIRELCEGWPTHRDAQEWAEFRNLFTNTVSAISTQKSTLAPSLVLADGCHLVAASGICADDHFLSSVSVRWCLIGVRVHDVVRRVPH